MADIRYLADSSTLVFRGQVMTVTPISRVADHHMPVPSIATIRVDRWYRGVDAPIVSLSFTFPGSLALNGHDCIDFRPDGYWIVFAVKKSNHLEMIDDCIGALAISPLLGPNLKSAGWPAQMEADFSAGLADQDSDARLLSIQRLGGLKLPSSRDALHRVISDGSALESKWAVYAALRTGDVTVLPAVRRLLAAGEHPSPEGAIAFELRNVSDRSLAPELIAILNGSPGEITRQSALIALSENVKDPKSAPVLAEFLSDQSANIRYLAMEGLKNITEEDACTLPSEWAERDIDPQVKRCRDWWQQTGHLQTWR